MSQQQRKRRRGVVLTREGLKRLEAAIWEAEVQNNEGERYSLESLSFYVGLDPKTIAKILEGKQREDRGSAKAKYTRQPVVLEYSTARLIEEFCNDISTYQSTPVKVNK